MMRVRFSELALADLEELAAYISQDSPAAAQQVVILRVYHGARNMPY